MPTAHSSGDAHGQADISLQTWAADVPMYTDSVLVRANAEVCEVPSEEGLGGNCGIIIN